MRTFVDTVTSLETGQKVEALISQCEECGSLFFGVFQIKGQDHFHLQCAECGVSYCPWGGECHNDPSESA